MADDPEDPYCGLVSERSARLLHSAKRKWFMCSSLILSVSQALLHSPDLGCADHRRGYVFPIKKRGPKTIKRLEQNSWAMFNHQSNIRRICWRRQYSNTVTLSVLSMKLVVPFWLSMTLISRGAKHGTVPPPQPPPPKCCVD